MFSTFIFALPFKALISKLPVELGDGFKRENPMGIIRLMRGFFEK